MKDIGAKSSDLNLATSLFFTAFILFQPHRRRWADGLVPNIGSLSYGKAGRVGLCRPTNDE